MNILYILIPISGLFVIFIIAALIWAVKSGQFDDLEGPAYRILMDEEFSEPEEKKADIEVSKE